MDITERIKTFEDAYNELGEEDDLVAEYKSLIKDKIKHSDDVIAHLKLKIIVKALNEGWEPTYDEDGSLYHACFYVFAKSEYEKFEEDWKKACRIVGRSHFNPNVYCALAFAHPIHAASCSTPYYGSHLACKTEKLAVYCGAHFLDIWADYLFC